MREFLRHTDSEIMLDYLDKNDAWALLDKEDTCPHGCLHFARYSTCTMTRNISQLFSRALSSQYPQYVLPTVDALSSSLSSIYDPQRITVVAFYSEVNHADYLYLTCYSVAHLHFE